MGWRGATQGTWRRRVTVAAWHVLAIVSYGGHMPTTSKSAVSTTDHKVIQQWVEARDGCPATVKSTHKKGDPGLLRVDFPGYSGEDTLECISWDEWFKGFDENNLAFLYEDDPKSR